MKVNKTGEIELKVVPQMSMTEFKAWLEGFSECFKTGAPNKAQWKRIEERLCAVSVEHKITYNYTPNWWPHWYSNTLGGYTGIRSSGSISYGTPAQTGQTIMASNNVNESLSTNLIAAATTVGVEEAKEFTV